MDGLTQFAQLLLNKNAGQSTNWTAFETAYKTSITTKQPAPQPTLSDPQVSKWNKLSAEQRHAGFIVAFQNCKRMNKESEFLTGLLIDNTSTDAELIFKYHNVFPFDGKDVSLNDVEIEKDFLFNFNQDIFKQFYENSIVFGWSDTKIEYKSKFYDVQDLAMVKYVTSQYNSCNTTGALTYKSLKDDELHNFDNCIEAAIQLKNKTILDFDEALHGFAQYKLHQLPADRYEEVAEIENLDHDSWKHDMLDEFQNHTLSWTTEMDPNRI